MTEFIVHYWVEFFFGLCAGGVGIGFRWLYKQFRNVREEFQAVKMGEQAILRDNIIRQYNKCIEQGYIPIYALENVEAMYKQYHALGGNGTITHLVDELKELPVMSKPKGIKDENDKA